MDSRHLGWGRAGCGHWIQALLSHSIAQSCIAIGLAHVCLHASGWRPLLTKQKWVLQSQGSSECYVYSCIPLLHREADPKGDTGNWLHCCLSGAHRHAGKAGLGSLSWPILDPWGGVRTILAKVGSGCSSATPSAEPGSKRWGSQYIYIWPFREESYSLASDALRICGSIDSSCQTWSTSTSAQSPSR